MSYDANASYYAGQLSVIVDEVVGVCQTPDGKYARLSTLLNMIRPEVVAALSLHQCTLFEGNDEILKLLDMYFERKKNG